MFEEFSLAVESGGQQAVADIYQQMIQMDPDEALYVEHDCGGVALHGHQSMMYGADSKAEDCQDVRDMMFFVPDLSDVILQWWQSK